MTRCERITKIVFKFNSDEVFHIHEGPTDTLTYKKSLFLKSFVLNVYSTDDKYAY